MNAYYIYLGAVERIIGDVSGIVNNVGIKNLPLLITAITNDGTVYSSVRYVPESIGFSLRILTPLADIVGWMYGRSSKDAHKGVAVIGTQFTRNATVLFDTGLLQQLVCKIIDKIDLITTTPQGAFQGHFTCKYRVNILKALGSPQDV